MAGGPLLGMYSGMRGLDLGPTRLRNENTRWQDQFREDIRRALAGEKIATSELALRQDAEEARRATEMKRMALEGQQFDARMGLEQQKLGQELNIEKMRNDRVQEKRLERIASDYEENMRKRQMIAQLIIAGKQKGVDFNIEDGWPVPVDKPPMVGKGQPGAAEQKDGMDFWQRMWARAHGQDPDVPSNPESSKDPTAEDWEKVLGKGSYEDYARIMKGWPDEAVESLASGAKDSSVRRIAKEELKRRGR